MLQSLVISLVTLVLILLNPQPDTFFLLMGCCTVCHPDGPKSCISEGGTSENLGVLMTKLTQVVCQPLTRRVFYHKQNWHILNWVLQVIQGYRIDLTHTPYQVLQPPPIQLSRENHAMVSQTVQELLINGAIVETTPSPASFISQIFLFEKKG